ncbi:MAG: hypothetical protein KKI02_00315 [Planctomycetes bacterium]|nr:hypothetical protein [Planctomycetota bacterium]
MAATLWERLSLEILIGKGQVADWSELGGRDTAKAKLARCGRCANVRPGGCAVSMTPCTQWAELRSELATPGDCEFFEAAENIDSGVTFDAEPPSLDRQPATFVYPYLAAAAVGDELLYSVRSIEKFYHGEADIWIVGDRPPWWRRDDRFIHCPQVRGGARIDRAHKLDVICRDDRIPESFVWMQDDIYFVKPVDLAFLATPWTRRPSPLSPAELDTWKPTRSFQKQNRTSFVALAARGKSLYDHAAHVPVLYRKANVRRMLDDYNMLHVPHVDDLVYGNEFANPDRPPRFVDTKMCRINGRTSKSGLCQRLAPARMLNHRHGQYKGAVEAKLERMFAEPSRWETPGATTPKSTATPAKAS